MKTPHPLRTTPVSSEIWDVVGVVLGEHRMKLTGWQYDDAIRAMTALGDSVVHIGWSMFLHPATVAKRAKKLGLPARIRDARLDLVGIFIAVKGGRIHLTGRDRIAAIRVMGALGVDSAEIARRLFMEKPETVSKLAANHGIRLVAINAEPADVKRYRREHDADQVVRELIAA